MQDCPIDTVGLVQYNVQHVVENRKSHVRIAMVLAKPENATALLKFTVMGRSQRAKP